MKTQDLDRPRLNAHARPAGCKANAVERVPPSQGFFLSRQTVRTTMVKTPIGYVVPSSRQGVLPEVASAQTREMPRKLRERALAFALPLLLSSTERRKHKGPTFCTSVVALSATLPDALPARKGVSMTKTQVMSPAIMAGGLMAFAALPPQPQHSSGGTPPALKRPAHRLKISTRKRAMERRPLRAARLSHPLRGSRQVMRRERTAWGREPAARKDVERNPASDPAAAAQRERPAADKVAGRSATASLAVRERA